MPTLWDTVHIAKATAIPLFPRAPQKIHWCWTVAIIGFNPVQSALVILRGVGNGPFVGLASFKFHARRGHLRLHFSDGCGRDLEGRAVMPMVAFASDLVAEVARRKRGSLRGLSVDLDRGVLRATVDVDQTIEVVRIDGPDFESLVRPRSATLIEWAEFNYGRPSLD
jgi:hypothetical protein